MDYEKNSPYTPEDVFAQSAHEFWWKDEHGREWKAKPVIEVTREKHHMPPKLGRTQGLRKGENTLDITHPDIAALWHPTKNGDLYPDDVIATSARRIWWLDPKCGHEWEQRIWYTVKKPFCPCNSKRNRTLIPGVNDLASKRPDLISSWSPNNDKTPSDVVFSSATKALWICDQEGEWEQQVSLRAKSKNPCPFQGNRKQPPCKRDGKCPQANIADS